MTLRNGDDVMYDNCIKWLIKTFRDLYWSTLVRGQFWYVGFTLKAKNIATSKITAKTLDISSIIIFSLTSCMPENFLKFQRAEYYTNVFVFLPPKQYYFSTHPWTYRLLLYLKVNNYFIIVMT